MPPKGWRKSPDICRACWPQGWPEGAENAMCEHGSYTRKLTAEAEEEA